MFTSSSSFSPLSRGLENQTQLPTPVTPIQCTASLYSLRTRAHTHTHTHTAAPSTGSLIEPLLKTENEKKNIGGSAGILNMFVTNGDAIRDRRGVDMKV